MIEVPSECATCAALRRALHVVEAALTTQQRWMDELRPARNEAEARLRKQDAVLAALYADQANDRRRLQQQADWLAEYVPRLLAAEAELTGRRGRPPRRQQRKPTKE
jgi:hypothetical protein